MSIDLSKSNVTLDDKKFYPMLINLQANILKFHGRMFAYHLFIQFIPGMELQAKQWIVSFAASKITTSFTQLYDSARRKADSSYDGGSVFTLSLSSSGYNFLNIDSSITANDEFKNGLRGADTQQRIMDNFDNWEDRFLFSKLDMLIITADDDADIAEQNAKDIIKKVELFGRCVVKQRGNVLKMDGTNVGIEHFGYADGISQPMYLKDEISSQKAPASGSRQWDDETSLNMVLVEEKDGIENCFGSYFVFRKLEQNVKGFKIGEGDLPEDPKFPQYKRKLSIVKDAAGKDNDELSGAMIVGRFENSMPVTKLSTSKKKPTDLDPDSNSLDNDFDYRDDPHGFKCPFHAHVRIVNPRNGNPNPVEVRTHRITRRAIPWDDNDPKRIPDDKILSITNEMLDGNQPEGKVGLLFMCYQSDIKDHFEELQGQWANTGIIDPATIPIGEDSLITQGKDALRSIPKQWGKNTQSDKFQFSGFVTMRGGEYFYTPSIPYLKNL